MTLWCMERAGAPWGGTRFRPERDRWKRRCPPWANVNKFLCPQAARCSKWHDFNAFINYRTIFVRRLLKHSTVENTIFFPTFILLDFAVETWITLPDRVVFSLGIMNNIDSPPFFCKYESRYFRSMNAASIVSTEWLFIYSFILRDSIESITTDLWPYGTEAFPSL